MCPAPSVARIMTWYTVPCSNSTSFNTTLSRDPTDIHATAHASTAPTACSPGAHTATSKFSTPVPPKSVALHDTDRMSVSLCTSGAGDSAPPMEMPGRALVAKPADTDDTTGGVASMVMPSEHTECVLPASSLASTVTKYSSPLTTGTPTAMAAVADPTHSAARLLHVNGVEPTHHEYPSMSPPLSSKPAQDAATTSPRVVRFRSVERAGAKAAGSSATAPRSKTAPPTGAYASTRTPSEYAEEARPLAFVPVTVT